MRLSKQQAYEFFLSKGYTQTSQGQWSKDGTNVDGNRSRVQEQQDHSTNPHQGDDEEAPNDDYEAGVSEDHGQHDTQFQIAARFYFSDNRRRDLDGALNALFDTLVDAGVLADDRWQIVPRIVVEGFPCAKGEERVEVTIEELK